MRTRTFLRVTALSLVLLAVSAPAWATRTGTALAICVSRGADCSIANKGNDYEICVNNTDGRQCVSCPNLAQDKQECSVARTGKDTPPPTTGVAGLLAEEYVKAPRKPEHPRKP
jgi:hypothetical protein